MGYPRKGIVTGLTPSEKIFLLLHPHLIGTIKEDADKALSEAATRYPGSLHNGEGDAFRHCYWSAMLTRDIGEHNALKYLSAHEDFADNPAGEKTMDMHNNHQGIAVGKAAIPNAPDSALIQGCIDALTAGKLKTSL